MPPKRKVLQYYVTTHLQAYELEMLTKVVRWGCAQAHDGDRSAWLDLLSKFEFLQRKLEGRTQ